MRYAAAASLALFALAACAPEPDAPAPGHFACDARATAIHAVHGRGVASPLTGRTVDVLGVVSADFQQQLGGFFVEAPAEARDADPSTSEGVFVRVAQPRDEVEVGRLLRVRGVVAERGDGVDVETVIDDVRQVLDCGAATLPPPASIAGPVEDWERLEGMRVSVAVPLTVTGNAGLERFGSLDVSLTGRLFQPTERAPPGPAADAIAAANRRARLTLDDNLLVENPRRVWYLPAPPAPTRPLRVGSRLTGVEGVLQQRGASYLLQLTQPLASIEQAPRPAEPPAIDPDGDPAVLRVVAFNLQNWFNGDGGRAGFPTARGAADRDAMLRQRARLVATLEALKPDVAALMEVENDGYGADGALAQLVAALNRRLGAAGDYALVDPGVPALGGDEIAVALIHRTRRVALKGRVAQLDGGAFAAGNRVPLAASFAALDDGVPFTVVANHFKSKGGCEDAQGADRDQGDGQGCWNATRRAAAEQLADWLATNPTGIATGTLVLGDLNAYAQEDPVRHLIARGYVDLLAASDAYSFVFAGQSGRLDHALASAALAPRVTGAAEWHVNADELASFGYDGRIGRRGVQREPFRASDHDPLIVGLRPR